MMKAKYIVFVFENHSLKAKELQNENKVQNEHGQRKKASFRVGQNIGRGKLCVK